MFQLKDLRPVAAPLLSTPERVSTPVTSVTPDVEHAELRERLYEAEYATQEASEEILRLHAALEEEQYYRETLQSQLAELEDRPYTDEIILPPAETRTKHVQTASPKVTRAQHVQTSRVQTPDIQTSRVQTPDVIVPQVPQPGTQVRLTFNTCFP